MREIASERPADKGLNPPEGADYLSPAAKPRRINIVGHYIYHKGVFEFEFIKI